jgi:hypothetical protein
VLAAIAARIEAEGSGVGAEPRGGCNQAIAILRSNTDDATGL